MDKLSLRERVLLSTDDDTDEFIGRHRGGLIDAINSNERNGISIQDKWLEYVEKHICNKESLTPESGC